MRLLLHIATRGVCSALWRKRRRTLKVLRLVCALRLFCRVRSEYPKVHSLGAFGPVPAVGIGSSGPGGGVSTVWVMVVPGALLGARVQAFQTIFRHFCAPFHFVFNSPAKHGFFATLLDRSRPHRVHTGTKEVAKGHQNWGIFSSSCSFFGGASERGPKRPNFSHREDILRVGEIF